MPATTSGQFEPLHSAHAIEQAVFTVQFDTPLSDDALNQARITANQFEAELPALVETQGFVFALAAPGFVPPPSPTAGFVRRSINPDGTVAHELRVERNSLVFITTRYTRWEDIWSRANNYFSTLLPLYLQQGGKIINVGQNFVDKFVWHGEFSECRPLKLLRTGSKYICPHVFEVEDFWHSHTGAFLKVDQYTKRLININLDYLDELRPGGMKRLVAIGTVANDQFNQIGFEPLSIPNSDFLSFVAEHMQSLHRENKKILGLLINDEMCRRIALGVNQ